jgi:competence CoiA-like predicted nuclease
MQYSPSEKNKVVLVLYAENSDEHLVTAEKGSHCICPDCREPVISRCGAINDPHFAHRPFSKCGDQYYDRKSPWHREWQRTIENPEGGVNIEVDIRDREYKKRADLLTKNGIIVEFQKSPLPLEERFSRERHYKNMVWIAHTDLINSKTWSINPNSNIPILFDNEGTLFIHERERKKDLNVCTKEWFVTNLINGDLELRSLCDFISDIVESQERLERAYFLRKIQEQQEKEIAYRKQLEEDRQKKEEERKRQTEEEVRIINAQRARLEHQRQIQEQKFFADPESLQHIFRLISSAEDEQSVQEKLRQVLQTEQSLAENIRLRKINEGHNNFRWALLSKGYTELNENPY